MIAPYVSGRLLTLVTCVVACISTQASAEPIDGARPVTPAALDRPDIVVTVTDFRSDDGSIQWALFANDEGFPGDFEDALMTGQSPIMSLQSSIKINNLKPGVYALSIFHDEDSDGKMKTSFIGIPKEGVAVSNNAKGRMGPPKFANAKFMLEAGKPIAQVLKLIYF